MTPNRNKTLVGLPCVKLDDNHEPFPLCNPKRSGVLPLGVMTRDVRGTQGSVPVYIPPARRTVARAPVFPVAHLVAALIVVAAVGAFLSVWP